MEQRDHGDENDHLLTAYGRRWADDDYEMISVEEYPMNMWDYLDVAKEALDIVIRIVLIVVLVLTAHALGLLLWAA